MDSPVLGKESEKQEPAELLSSERALVLLESTMLTILPGKSDAYKLMTVYIYIYTRVLHPVSM